MTSLDPDLGHMALLAWRLTPATPSKKGMFAGYLDAATSSLDQLAAWAHEFPGCCWKCVPAGSDVWFLDVDTPGPDHASDGVAALRELCALHGRLPLGPVGRTPSGGFLLPFKDGGHPIAPGSARLAPGLDVLAGRCCPMVPPSRRHGRPYRWLRAPWEFPPPLAPEWLLSRVAPPPAPPRPHRPLIATEDRSAQAMLRSFDVVAGAGPGQRNFALLRRATLMGGFVGAGMIGADEVERELIAVGMAVGQSRSQAQATVRSGIRRGLERPFETGRA